MLPAGTGAVRLRRIAVQAVQLFPQEVFFEGFALGPPAELATCVA